MEQIPPLDVNSDVTISFCLVNVRGANAEAACKQFPAGFFKVDTANFTVKKLRKKSVGSATCSTAFGIVRHMQSCVI